MGYNNLGIVLYGNSLTWINKEEPVREKEETLKMAYAEADPLAGQGLRKPTAIPLSKATLIYQEL